MVLYFLTFVLAFLLAWYLTPVFQKAALRVGIVERPDGKLKRKAEPVAYLGGLSIYLSFLITLALTFQFDQEVLGILLAGTIIVLLGLIDDFGVLTPKVKLVGQTIAAGVLIKSGICIELAFLPPAVSLLLSFLWLLAMINAFNLIDIMDGLSAGVAFICSLVLFTVAVANGKTMIATLTAALTGCLLSFLRYNFEPAKIYLGDAGSMFLGLMMGTLGMIGDYTRYNVVACLAPVVIFGVPLFDMLFVMYIRRLRGIPVVLGSPDHFALRLRKWRLTTRRTVVLSYLAALILGMSALIIMRVTNQTAVIILLALLTVTLLLGYLLKKIDMTL
jgi:UDP-GlcNAc:undecaprenyl-phosphate GlcNAc-1-phosphate transferase